MPSYDEVHGTGKCLTYSENGFNLGSCALWLSNYLDENQGVTGVGLQNIKGICGYWTLSSFGTEEGYASRDSYCVTSDLFGCDLDDEYGSYTEYTCLGVRPVINVKL